MAFRGRGRGRGFGRGGYSYAVEKPFELFPEVELPDPKSLPVDTKLLLWNTRLIKGWKSSAYHLEGTTGRKGESQDIESQDIKRFRDWKKPKKTFNRDSIYELLQMDSSNFPHELVKDLKPQPTHKRGRRNPGEIKVEDFFDNIEQKYKDIEEEDEKEKNKVKNEDEEDEENSEEKAEEDGEYSDDGDYNQNRDFDDDEDDYNMEEGEDEAIY